jgi:hypothetical protein
MRQYGFRYGFTNREIRLRLCTLRLESSSDAKVYEVRARICKRLRCFCNRFRQPILPGGPASQIGLSYRPGNRFLSSLKGLKNSGSVSGVSVRLKVETRRNSVGDPALFG